jgi:hypothetical protein
MPTFKTEFPHMSKGASVSDIALAFDAAMKERAGRAGLQVDGTGRIEDLTAAEIISIRIKNALYQLDFKETDTLMDLAVRLEPAWHRLDCTLA